MATWTTSDTQAHMSVKTSLKAVDGVMSYMKDTKGKPPAKERSLYAAAIVFTYGIWENYVEQLAIELAEGLSGTISSDRVPDRVRTLLEKSTAWEITVSPGWRRLWLQKVNLSAIGDEGEKYGLNTAKTGQVSNLLALAGISQPFEGIDPSIVPKHLGAKISKSTEAIDRLVQLRGEIVHTGTVPDTLRKKHVREWRQFVEQLVSALDARCREECRELLPRRSRRRLQP